METRNLYIRKKNNNNNNGTGFFVSDNLSFDFWAFGCQIQRRMYDDIVYVTLLLVSILWGKVTRSVSDTRGRKWTSSLFGLGLVGLVSGYSSLHPLFSVALHTCLVKLSPRRLVHWINFIFGFAHLFLFRSAILDSPPAHTNAIQMIMTLKLMGLAFEIHDDTGLNPNAEDIFHYAFAHSGILTGPYYRFRTFQDLYETPYGLKADCETLMLQRIIRVPFYLILFLVSGYFFPISAVLSENFYESTSFWWRLFYMTPVFFNFRMRLYIGFILSECSCIMAGLGAYPCKTEPKPGQGPSKPITKEELESDIEINFETIHNIDEFKTESVTTMRDALKTWNMTVQWWLAANVYRRLPGYSREFRAFVVMMVSFPTEMNHLESLKVIFR